MLQHSRFVDYFSLQFLKPYFDVNNRYVLKKIKYILFPFLYKVEINIKLNIILIILFIIAIGWRTHNRRTKF